MKPGYEIHTNHDTTHTTHTTSNPFGFTTTTWIGEELESIEVTNGNGNTHKIVFESGKPKPP